MELTINGLKRYEDWKKADIKLPGYDVEEVVRLTKENPKWVHFGIGNIFRIFLGGIADTLLEKESWTQGSPVWNLLTTM